MSTRRGVYFTTHWCYICGLSIPQSIASPSHDLFGTVDHVIPVSKGGRNILENRRAAHRFCNSAKGDRDLSEVGRDALAVRVQMLLNRYGFVVGPKKMKLAKARRRADLGERPDTGPLQTSGRVANKGKGGEKGE